MTDLIVLLEFDGLKNVGLKNDRPNGRFLNTCYIQVDRCRAKFRGVSMSTTSVLIRTSLRLQGQGQ